MPSLNFPTATTVGEQYLDWVWNGVGWDSLQTLPGGLPAGAIIQWGGSTAPVNWLLCDGSAVSRTTYSSLFAAVGTSYGTGDGSTTFNLPDLRGRVPVGKNGGSFGTLGATGGAETVTLTEAQMPSHTHTGTTSTGGDHSHAIYGSNGGSAGASISITGNSNNDRSWYLPGGIAASAGSHNHTFTTAATGGGQSHNNLQPYQVVNYIIKVTAAITPGESELAPRVGVLEQNPNISGNITVAGNSTVSGRMVAPNQPSFNATANFGAMDVVAGAQIPFAVALSNKGNCYNATTSRFTAPVAGSYFFSFHVYRYTGYISQPTFRINGVAWNPASIDLALAVGGSPTESSTINMTMIAVLSAGDYVDVIQRNTVTARYYGGHSFFMGHLIG